MGVLLLVSVCSFQGSVLGIYKEFEDGTSVTLSTGSRLHIACHPSFFDEHLGSAVGAIDYVRGSGNRLLTSIPLSIRGIDFCDCLASTLGRIPAAIFSGHRSTGCRRRPSPGLEFEPFIFWQRRTRLCQTGNRKPDIVDSVQS